jgi:glycosyltransferase involved in cell wall biosynthesis
MRVLMLAQSFAPIVGGEERVVEDLSRELVDRGHDVAIATLRMPDGLAAGADTGLRVHSLGTTSYRVSRGHRDTERRHAPPAPDPETVLDLDRVLREERPDVVHAHNWILHSFLPLERRFDAGLVLSLHDYGLICATKRLRRKDELCSGPGPLKCVACAAEHYGVGKGPLVAAGTRLSESRVRDRVDVFLPVSSTVEELCRMRPGDVSQVTPNFIRDLPAADLSDPRLDLLPDEPFVLFFGDLTVDKGAWHLAEAYRELDDPPPLVLIGRCYLDELAKRPNVHVLGAWPHSLAIEAVRRSMMTAAPSLWPEPFGLVALEAAAGGKPIIASDIGGLRDIVVDGETGLLVPAGDRVALRSALRRMLGDPEMRDRFGRAAKVRAAEFTPASIVPRFEAAYELALARRRARGSHRA